MTETPLVKELRDQAAQRTKTADSPFDARKHTPEWRAADDIERLRAALVEVREKLMGSKSSRHSIEDALVPLDHALNQ